MAREPRRVGLLVIGGGAGGLSAARAGARRAIPTVLVERSRLGGECTFTGCVPSKTLIEAVARGESFKDATARLRGIVVRIATTENAAALHSEGVAVIKGQARFVGPRTVSTGSDLFEAERVIIATGSLPVVPEVAGLDTVRYLTNETVFDLERLPASLAVVGAGPTGCELAQVFARFGAHVHLVERDTRVLASEEPEASRVIAQALQGDRVELHLGTSLSRVGPVGSDELALELSDGTSVRVNELLFAAGRRPNVEYLDPQAGGVELNERGYVATDRHLRTTARGVYGVGDVTGRKLLTHVADEMGRIAVYNAFHRVRRRSFDDSTIPAVTFTDPEVARAGCVESGSPPGSRVATLSMASVDRAIAAGRDEGFVELIAAPRGLIGHLGGGRLVGATIVSPRAGEMIHELSLAMTTKVFVGRLAQAVHAYPTWSTAMRQAAAQFFFEVDGRSARPAGK